MNIHIICLKEKAADLMQLTPKIVMNICKVRVLATVIVDEFSSFP